MQQCRVQQGLVQQDLLTIERLDRLAEDRNISYAQLQQQRKLLIAWPDIQPAQLFCRFKIRGRKRSISKNKAQQKDMWAENQRRIKDDLRDQKGIPSIAISDLCTVNRLETQQNKIRDKKDLCIFDAQKLLCELTYEFYYNAIGSTFWVPKQGDNNVTVTKVEKCLGSISRGPSQLVKESNLCTVTTMQVPLLCCSQIGLQDFSKILNIHCCLLLLLVT